MSEFVVPTILQQVESCVARKDIEGCRNTFLQAIFDWSDYYTFNCSASPDSTEATTLQYKLIQLWQCYASFEANLKQFKKAVEVYEQAIQDTIVGKSSKIYRLCAEYYVAREKPANAQKVYINGLTANLSKKESDWLWCLLQNLIAVASGVHTSLTQLKEEVQKKVNGNLPDIPSEDIARLIAEDLKRVPLLTSQVAIDSKSTVQSPLKSDGANNSMKEEVVNPSLLDKRAAASNLQQSSNVIGNAILTKPIESIESKESDTSPASSASQISLNRTNTTMLSQSKLPSVGQGSSSTKGDQIGLLRPVGKSNTGDELDNLCGLSNEELVFLFHNRPPMLLVAPYREPLKTGYKDMQPDELQQLERFLGCTINSLFQPPDLSDVNRQKAEFYMDVLEELWLSQALKERHFDAWHGALKREQQKEHETLLERLSTTSMPDVACQLEKKKFSDKVMVQREMLNALLHKIYYILLIEQEKILYELQFPRFFKHILDKIQNINNILPPNNPKGLFFDDVTVREIATQRRFVCALLHVRLVKRVNHSINWSMVINSSASGISTDLETAMSINSGEHQKRSETNTMGMQSLESSNEIPFTSYFSGNDNILVSPLQQLPLSVDIPSTGNFEETGSTPSGSESARKKRRRRISIGSQSSNDFDNTMDIDISSLDRDQSFGQDTSFKEISAADVMSFTSSFFPGDGDARTGDQFSGVEMMDSFELGDNLDDYGNDGQMYFQNETMGNGDDYQDM